MGNINWDDVAELESIANQCIYTSKDVARARAALKAIYGYDVTYNDEIDDDCNKEDKQKESK